MTNLEKIYVDHFVQKLNFSISSLKYQNTDIKNLEHIKVKEFKRQLLNYLEILKVEQPLLYKLIISDLKKASK
jgi:hypothetical protein